MSFTVHRSLFTMPDLSTVYPHAAANGQSPTANALKIANCKLITEAGGRP